MPSPGSSASEARPKRATGKHAQNGGGARWKCGAVCRVTNQRLPTPPRARELPLAARDRRRGRASTKCSRTACARCSNVCSGRILRMRPWASKRLRLRLDQCSSQQHLTPRPPDRAMDRQQGCHSNTGRAESTAILDTQSRRWLLSHIFVLPLFTLSSARRRIICVSSIFSVQT